MWSITCGSFPSELLLDLQGRDDVDQTYPQEGREKYLARPLWQVDQIGRDDDRCVNHPLYNSKYLP